LVIADEVTKRILAAYEAGALVRICAWCNRVEIDGEWVLAPKGALLAIDAENTVSHGICPVCAANPPPQSADDS
jgi:hypothetical protein